MERKIAIYSRKSKYTGTGESIENQIELCRNYIQTLGYAVSGEDLWIFEDEGYSGSHTNRPQFTQMMKHARNKKISMIVCYRLDRISRNIGDFAKLIEELNALDLAFVSIKERFDTSSPLGRAMMYIASVFSQLERETIAERIRDNMLELAKTGRWLGGITPTGYTSQSVETITVDGKRRKVFQLANQPEEIAIVQNIYHTFLREGSLSKVETALLLRQIETKNKRNFSRYALRSILENPVYVIADQDCYKYFQALGVEIFGDPQSFNGTNGIMAYNKTIQKSGRAHQTRDYHEWIIAIGKHTGIISGADWVSAQHLLQQNKSKSYRKAKSNCALLSGLLFCQCGAYMRPKQNNRKGANGAPTFYYLCERKEKSRGAQCNIKNPKGTVLDKGILDIIDEIPIEMTNVFRHVEHFLHSTSLKEEALPSLEARIQQKENEIRRLVSLLRHTPEHTKHYITEEIQTLHQKKLDLQQQFQQQKETASLLSIHSDLFSFENVFDQMNMAQKRAALKLFLQKIVWDGTTASVFF